MENKFEHNSFGKRLKSMLKVDFRRILQKSKRQSTHEKKSQKLPEFHTIPLRRLKK